MNPEIKQKWIDALRSGEYKQGKGQLKLVDEYCCLGVLCDIAVKSGLDIKVTKGFLFTRYDEAELVLPESVQAWAELPSRDPIVNDQMLSHFNDDEGASFAEIAQLIEDNL